MIIVYRQTTPDVVHAYHTNGQALTVSEAYDPEEFGAIKVPLLSAEVGKPFDGTNGVDVPLGV